MRYAKTVFITAGVWGIVVLLPLNFLVDVTGHRYAPPVVPDLLLGLLFIAAFTKTPTHDALLHEGDQPGREGRLLK